MFPATFPCPQTLYLDPLVTIWMLEPQLPEPSHVLMSLISVNKRLLGLGHQRAPLLFLPGTDTVPLLGVCSLQGGSFPGAQIKNTVHFE